MASQLIARHAWCADFVGLARRSARNTRETRAPARFLAQKKMAQGKPSPQGRQETAFAAFTVHY